VAQPLGNRGAKIVLIGHAMGGLVARGFADVEAGGRRFADHLDRTPFLGSIRALDLLYFGLDFRSYAWRCTT